MASGLLTPSVMKCWLALVAASACSAGPLGPDAGLPDAAPPVGQGSEASAELVVNEVAPHPASGADWIELVNRSDAPVDLCGYLLTDLSDRLDHYIGLGGVLPPEECPPQELAAGAYLVVWADDGAGAGDGALHAPFKLGDADEVHILTVTGLGVDGLSYLYPLVDEGPSLARQPDGSGLFYPAEPSPGAANPEPAP